MALSLNDIREKARKFAKEWADEKNEHAEAKTFWDQFFDVFGVHRRRVAVFESPIKKHDGHGGYIDLLWKGVLLVEHKSRGKSLDRAKGQAFDYFAGLSDDDLPRYVIVSDFANFRLYDLEKQEKHQFSLPDLHKNIGLFGFMSGYEKKVYAEEDPVNIKAAERLGKLHDLLEKAKYEGHDLEVFMVRLLFCLFADDTDIFERSTFRDYIERRTAEDGSDLGMRLGKIFEVLDQPVERRQKTLDEQLAAFPHVNGELFKERIAFPDFNRAMRTALIEALKLDWGRISPAIFGSLFQSIMDAAERRNLGAHYTTESNILKALGPLFLDALRAEFDSIKTNKKKLEEFHDRLSKIRILDPACGCGNFLVIAYRELRRLELDVLRAIHGGRDWLKGAAVLNINQFIKLDVDQFYGIEIGEWPAQIARVALWLVDHQMNMEVAAEFGVPFIRLPLKKSATILHANALTVEWSDFVAPEKISYIVGNPPFVGAKMMDGSQREEMASVFAGVKAYGLLDYVAAWYLKAAEYISKNPKIEVAFVSTNSITQGEQVGVLWSEMFNRGVRLNFAHRTFQWTSEARGRAAVHCVIIGFAMFDRSQKVIFDYDTVRSDPEAIRVKNINAYLVDGPGVLLSNRSSPLSSAPEIGIGNKPIDDGNYLFTKVERDIFLRKEPGAKKFFRRWIGADEFINGWERWCLWLGEAKPEEINRLPLVKERVDAVREYRLRSRSGPTRALAKTPTRFHVENIPKKTYVVIPEVSSERRRYIPIGFEQPTTLSSNKLRILPNASLYHFGILTSEMHMAWMRYTTGRLESRYQYSVGIVYNNFPWPNPTEKQRSSIEQAAQAVLDARAKFPSSTLADLYDPSTMPPALTKAHVALDRAVDAAYGKSKFSSEAERVAFLFSLYEKQMSPLLPVAKKTKPKQRKRALE